LKSQVSTSKLPASGNFIGKVEEPDPEINKKLDAAYRAKYRRNPSSVDHINSPEAHLATIKLVPRSAGS